MYSSYVDGLIYDFTFLSESLKYHFLSQRIQPVLLLANGLIANASSAALNSGPVVEGKGDDVSTNIAAISGDDISDVFLSGSEPTPVDAETREAHHPQNSTKQKCDKLSSEETGCDGVSSLQSVVNETRPVADETNRFAFIFVVFLILFL